MSDTHLNESRSDAYAAAGVDITAGYKAVELFKSAVKSTFRDGVIGSVGGFGGLFAPNLSGMTKPVFVSGTDGVGTKLKIAFLLDRHDTIGIDCVAMVANDVVCCGAEPLFFLDYLAVGKNVPERVASIVAGVAKGCRLAGCALVGGETAEHPGMMPEDEYDVAGFCVGVVDEAKIIKPETVRPGDVLIALASSGLHSNGFSLVRKIFQPTQENLTTYIAELGKTLGEELLTPTRIYVKPLLSIIRNLGADIHGISHITGGGLYENVPRLLPDGIRAVIDVNKLAPQPVYDVLARTGNIPERDMYNTYNMGAGMILAIAPERADEAVRTLKALGENAYPVGECVAGEKGLTLTW